MRSSVYLCMSIHRRRTLLLTLLESGLACTQDEIAEALAQSGQLVTQATVSRDLAALGAVRGPDGYQLVSTISAQPAKSSAKSSGKSELNELISNHAIYAKLAHAMVVIRTAPGHAQMLAGAFDRWPLEGVIGSVAGDDTIFLATSSPKSATQVLAALERIIDGTQS